MKSTIVMIRPRIATRAVALAMLKFTKPTIVPVSGEQIPALTRPIIVIKRPIPTATAFLRPSGIDLMIASRIPQIESTINRIPSRRTAVKASCQEHPMLKTTV